MSIKTLGVICVILTTLSACAPGDGSAGQESSIPGNKICMKHSENDKTAVLAADKKFYEALNAMFTGDIKPMDIVWSHADDVAYMGPDNKFLKGWEKISAMWNATAAMKLGGKVEPEGRHIMMGQNLAVVYNIEVGENVDKGKPVKVSIRATNVFRMEDGQWKMAGHHTDLLPYLAK